ncbi:alpha/beta hydrolase [Phycicoccus sp. Root101]|uniref:alpha/beta hydrolase n=1 Tax=Phycicoccus sp. Root101 TaxID=1736421 RepID=UPI000702433E|nr:alpha/beta hydrolase [Phycicoccus sp. Root101]KQU65433.1 proteinase [Phycicoccus sp. Root101]
MTSRTRMLVAATAIVTVGLSGCSLLGGGDSGATPSTSSTAAARPPAGSEALASYYGQKLDWQKCRISECAKLEVPLDYAKPDGDRIEISVLRMKATKPRDRIGSLVVNPGGPGGSGVDYAQAADFIVGKPVRQRFDVVGFDPRGVQRSQPIDCLPDTQMDAFLGQDPTPDDAAEAAAFAASGKEFAQGCVQRTGALISHVSTVDAAKDMDILRSALGDEKLNYLGKSYGTFLGATYAGLFPKLVGRFVLDGVLPPDISAAEVAKGQAEGFERATRAYAANCVDEGDCPLGGSVDEVMSGMRALLTRLDQQPVPMQDGTLKQLTEGWAATGIAQAMYDQGSWGTLTDALAQVVRKDDGTELMKLADQYAQRNQNGVYAGNLLEAFYAISCLDNPDSPDPAVYAQRAADNAKVAPTWGPFLAWGSLVCGQWPVKSTEGQTGPHKISAEGSGPIVVVGTTRDPATPYEWSVRLRDQLSNAALLTFDGDGHTAYTRSNSCVDDAINDYYTDGKVPKDGTRC